MANDVRCPYCESTQVTAVQKGFSAGKALVGSAVAGPLGLLGGFSGSRDVEIVCLKCGKRWKPGQDVDIRIDRMAKESRQKRKQEEDERMRKEQEIRAAQTPIEFWNCPSCQSKNMNRRNECWKCGKQRPDYL